MYLTLYYKNTRGVPALKIAFYLRRRMEGLNKKKLLLLVIKTGGIYRYQFVVCIVTSMVRK
jgi:hypothetical protein